MVTCRRTVADMFYILLTISSSPSQRGLFRAVFDTESLDLAYLLFLLASRFRLRTSRSAAAIRPGAGWHCLTFDCLRHFRVRRWHAASSPCRLKFSPHVWAHRHSVFSSARGYGRHSAVYVVPRQRSIARRSVAQCRLWYDHGDTDRGGQLEAAFVRRH